MNDIVKKSKKLDKFYTNENVSKKLIKNINFNIFDFVIEPSAGSGSFSKNINHSNLFAMDLEPEHKNIKKKDWFDYKVPKKYKKVLIIGNPPFGKKNHLSKKFLKHAFSFNNVETIAMILPNVFKKYTMQKIIPKNYFIKKIIPLAEYSFSLDQKPYNIPTSFFIITKILKDNYQDLRQKTILSSSDFYFTIDEDYDFFIFGSAPHNILENGKKVNDKNRGYYIKSNISKKELINRFKNKKWNGHSSANGGVYWMTKIDIIEDYNKEYLGEQND